MTSKLKCQELIYELMLCTILIFTYSILMLSFDVLFLSLHSFRLLLDNKIGSELFSKPSQAIRNVDFQMIR